MPKRKPKPYEEINPRLHGTDSGWQVGCDCEACKKAHSLKAKIHNRAKMLDSQWVRKYRSDVHEQSLNEAYRYFNVERNPVGVPHGTERTTGKWTSSGWMGDYNNR